MTTRELHEILDDENKKISLKEFREILFELKHDVFKSQEKVSMLDEYKNGYYNGEQNAFYIALDISEHIEGEHTNCCATIKQMVNNCEECKLDECIGCEHSWSVVQEIKQLEKALELACNEIRLLNNNLKYNLVSEEFEEKRQVRLANLENDFKEQAKKEIENGR